MPFGRRCIRPSTCKKRGPQDDNIKFEIKIEQAKVNDMSNPIIEKLLAKTLRTDIPAFRPGDTVRVHVKIKEGDKERVQAFEGVVIKRDNGPQASFTVRKISFGQGVERIFPIQSKVIDKVDLVRSSKVRRARLFYLRGLRGKAARLRDVEKTAQ
jgi:large subunit ribosomal protein L19